jgi:hypothetical protein
VPTELPNQSPLPGLEHVFTFVLLLRGVGAFAGLMVLHVLVWRLLRVRKQIAWLFLIFLGVPTLAFLGGLAGGSDPTEWSLWYLLVLTLSSCYILGFPAIQTESPTLTMVRYLYKNKASGGLPRDEIIARMASDRALHDRVKDLRDNGLIRDSGGAQRLSGAGRLVAVSFFHYRRIVKLPMGGG